MLQIERLDVGYGPLTVLRGVNLAVNKGEIVTVIGANGAGKSTLLKSISGLLLPTAGTITFEGQEIGRRPPHEIVGRGVAQVPEGRQLFSELSVLDNLELGAFSWGKADPAGKARELHRVYEMFPILEERREQMAGTLSGGQQQMLAIGRALMGAPKVLLLDEPSLGLSPLIAGQVLSALRELNKAGLTIMLVEQNAKAALKSTNHAYVLEQGRIVHEGISSDLANDPDVIAHYLGQAGETKQAAHA
jgi:branched-chain amino acid transport system ATP-binding protein